MIFNNSHFQLKSEFIKNTLTLMSGTTIAQVVAFILSPVLTRLYTPADFGQLATFMAITGIISTVSCLRYELAIILPKSDKESNVIVALSVLTNLIFVILSILGITLFLIISRKSLIENHAPSIYFLIPVAIMLTGMVQIFGFWSMRLKKFRQNALARIGNSGGNISLGVILGLVAHGGGAGLILAYVGAILINLYILTFRSVKGIVNSIRQIPRPEILTIARKYKKFPLINTPHALIGAFKDSGIIFLIKEFFGISILGSYSFAYRVLSIPTSVISASISQVFFQKSAQLQHDGKPLKPLLIKIYKIAALVGLPIFVTLYFVAPGLFAFIFSEQYRQAGKIATYLIPWLFINFVASSASTLPLVYNKLLVPMLFSVSDIVLQVIAISIGWYYGSFALAFTLMGIFCFINTLISFFWFFSIVNNPARYESTEP